MKRILQNTLLILNRAEKRRLILFALADLLISLLDIGVLALLLLMVGSYTQPGSIAKEWFTADKPVQALAILGLLFIVKNLAAYFIVKSKYGFVYKVAARLSERGLLQYLEGNYRDYVSKDSAVHIRRISQQPVEFCHYVLSGLLQIFSELIMILLAITAILVLDAELFLLLVVMLTPPLIVLSLYIKRRLRNVRGNIKSGSEKALQHLKEALAGYIESNVYNTKQFFTHRYSHKQQGLNRYLAQLQAVQVLPTRLMEIFAVLGLLALIAYNEWAQPAAMISVFTIGAFLAAAYKIIPGLVKILNANGQIRTYAFTAEDLVSHQIPKNAHTHEEINTLHELEFRQVSFYYDDKQVLKKFDLHVQGGEMVGLSGLSGKGKTTLFNLLLGFLEQTKGEIVFNTQATTANERQLFWKNISYVKQQPFLLHDSLLTNISLNDGNYNEQQLQQAIKAAGLDAFIAQLPNGLQEVIAEGGKNISGGQRQRIAFARALYKNADLLLLDEPFNELDEASEQAMLQHLRCLSQQGKMVILITHNQKSLSFCSKIISMDAAR